MNPAEILLLLAVFAASVVATAWSISRISVVTVTKVAEAVTAPFLTPPPLAQRPPEPEAGPVVIVPPWEDPWTLDDASEPVDLDLEG